jgi:hypothetical protein
MAGVSGGTEPWRRRLGGGSALRPESVLEFEHADGAGLDAHDAGDVLVAEAKGAEAGDFVPAERLGGAGGGAASNAAAKAVPSWRMASSASCGSAHTEM